MEEIDNPYEITKRVIKMAKNTKAKKEFKKGTTKHQKVVALTSEVGSLTSRLKTAENKFNKKKGHQDSGKSPGGGKKTKHSRVKPEDPWRITKKYNTITDEGVKYVYFPKHTDWV